MVEKGPTNGFIDEADVLIDLVRHLRDGLGNEAGDKMQSDLEDATLLMRKIRDELARQQSAQDLFASQARLEAERKEAGGAKG